MELKQDSNFDKEKVFLLDLKQILSFVEGRRLMAYVLGMTHIFNSTFADNERQSAFNEGVRWIGLKILSKIAEADLSAWEFILKEEAREILEEKIKNEKEPAAGNPLAGMEN